MRNDVRFCFRYKERSEVEASFFAINTRLATLKQPSFAPPDGVSVHDLQRSWDSLERAEHQREVALREELLRQERLEQLAYKFERKASPFSMKYSRFLKMVVKKGVPTFLCNFKVAWSHFSIQIDF